MRNALSAAKTVAADESATESKVKEATDNLNNAVLNLIKAKNANTTLLHEAIEAADITKKDDYTPKSWSAYIQAKEAAVSLMDRMFDASGNPTTDNSPAVQAELKTLATKLTQAQKDLDKRASITNPYAAKHAGVVADAIEELHTRYANADPVSYTHLTLPTN